VLETVTEALYKTSQREGFPPGAPPAGEYGNEEALVVAVTFDVGVDDIYGYMKFFSNENPEGAEYISLGWVGSGGAGEGEGRGAYGGFPLDVSCKLEYYHQTIPEATYIKSGITQSETKFISRSDIFRVKGSVIHEETFFEIIVWSS
jgi:hypothetical protein